MSFPTKQGLYDPRYEHDACGTGFVVDIKGRKSHDIVQKALQVLLNLERRGACGITDLMATEGIQFVTNTHVGHDYSAGRLLRECDAVVLCGVAWAPLVTRLGTPTE